MFVNYGCIQYDCKQIALALKAKRFFFSFLSQSRCKIKRVGWKTPFLQGFNCVRISRVHLSLIRYPLFFNFRLFEIIRAGGREFLKTIAFQIVQQKLTHGHACIWFQLLSSRAYPWPRQRSAKRTFCVFKCVGRSSFTPALGAIMAVAIVIFIFFIALWRWSYIRRLLSATSHNLRKSHRSVVSGDKSGDVRTTRSPSREVDTQHVR